MVLRLEILGARLARWGRCTGILDNDPTLITREIEGKLKLYLENIESQFEKARKKAARYSPDEHMGKDKDGTRANVRKAIRQWTTKYTQKCHTGKKKVQWAVHDKKILETMVCNIRDHMDDMMEVFGPGEMKMISTTQLQLQKEDIKNLEHGELEMLKHLSKDQDEVIVKAVEYAIETRQASSHIFSGSFKINGENDGARYMFGDDVARGVVGTGHYYTGDFNVGGCGTK